MDKNWNNGSNTDENMSKMGFESLSLGQKLLSKCLKKTGISVSVRGIAVNTTSQIKMAGSAWKSENKYDSGSESQTGTLDDVSFPDLLGSSNREASVNNQTSERSSVTNDSYRVPKDSRNKFKVKHRLPTVQSVNSPSFRNSLEGSLSNTSYSFRNSSFDDDDDILGTDFLMPGMKGNYPLGFTNFIGRGVQSPPPPPPTLPYPTNPLTFYQTYHTYTLTRFKTNNATNNTGQRTQSSKAANANATSTTSSTSNSNSNVRPQSPTVSESNWMDSKSEGYNEAELTTAIDSLNHSILADRTGEESLTIKPYVGDKMSQQYLDLTNFEDNSLLLQDSLYNHQDRRFMDQLDNTMADELETPMPNEQEGENNDQLNTVTEKRKSSRFTRRKKFSSGASSSSSVNTNTNTNTASVSTGKPPKEKKETTREDNRAVSQSRSNSTDSQAAQSSNSVITRGVAPSRDGNSLKGESSDPTKQRRPRHRTRPRKKDPTDENWRETSSTTESKQENPANSENPRTKSYFKSRRYRQPQANNAQSNTNN